MKNATEKVKANQPYHKQPRLTEAMKVRLVKQTKMLYINKDFIEFIESTIKKLPAKDKLAALYFFKKLAVQVPRYPDPDFYQAFKDEIDEEMSDVSEQLNFEPIRWITAEIEYWLNSSERLTVEDVNQKLDVMQDAKKRLSKDWLTKEEVMELFRFSRATLNRRISEGMPHHKNGKKTYFYQEEINKWMKEAA
ncbi:helix-turn-helix domain-containing protein [Mucilaginibacter sp. KACC 22063]|uniref:helix-turn-helix domain-containing protein n=1 Tax=Mucilaginibacter sp. KACC 22063 TaxID=3025666 RepID=UPI00236660CA|nr:helix-turn-helix domain-containing protein [Mucilaginibacter sp. KACC 22063]WDF55257.1 helix-turn-helix domain-containing protein [Mucilaginibacter sp. KACC 22063]